MKQNEIKKCSVCGEGVMHNNDIHFYKAKIEHMAVDFCAVQRQRGLEMMLGSGQLAAVMGTNEDIAVPITTVDIVVCFDCAMNHLNSLPALMEMGHETPT